jgi:TetR/AcrR family tetracycline transcriptional repressor
LQPEFSSIEPRQADLLTGTATHFTFGRVIEEQSSPSAEALKEVNFDDMLHNFPHVAASVERTLEDMENGYDEFEASLRLIVGHA